ncbi:uncharacterized protein E0L32_004721 [Thyridium curvatum]|uniref:ABC1 atypical kinase-like domain-containing protein n=1 Tax=Thyridium curvatum TaxID=1093900 RepID=A0A507B5S6_9PEZI|nr:uncharacterized protein E0L32_004721 [Thyridium curvatum]TPX15163.1 hypothetical protein E0L32_004721 [Thyridium curvatum]
MRFVDFALDLAAVLSASRSVAAKHVALRSRQLERFNRTSSVAQALREKGQQAQDSAAAAAAAAQSEATTQQDAEPTVQAQPGGSPRSAVDEALESEFDGDAAVASQPETRSAAAAAAAPAPSLGADGALDGLYPAPPPSFSRAAKRAPEDSAILRELRQRQAAAPVETKADVDESTAPQANEAKSTPDEDSEVPEGIDINVFRTSRGSRLIERFDKSKKGDKELSTKSSVGSTALFKDVDPTLEARPLVSAAAPKGVPPSNAETEVAPDFTVPPSQIPESSEVQASFTQTTETPVVKSSNPDIEKSAEPAKAAAERGEALGSSTTFVPHQLRESKVPATRLSRMWNYGGLAAGMLGGALTESISRGFGGGGQGSVMLSPANMERLVSKLSRMRGAALKLGQMMSFQDSKMLPAPIQEVLQRVQDRADYMPAWQRDRVLKESLGAEWRELFDTFEDKPIAAASIGQVHRATLKSTGEQVAVKIQFPGVADSINSDLDNLGILLTATKLLPRGLYLNKTIDNARTELGWECDYIREAECAEKYREYLKDEPETFIVPRIFPEACGKHVLTMEYLEGIGVTRVKSFTQEQRDWIGTQILRLCLREITEFKFMQTDPNWTNFMYNAKTNKLELLDFGASRAYPDAFISQYIQLLMAAARSDHEGVKAWSEKLGYLTGHESKVMVEAHVQSVLTLAEPFLGSAPELYDFQGQTITERVKALIPVMIRERLAPPPEETYSLHRKLSGAFLLCARLGSRVRCRDLFEEAIKKTDLVPR